MTGQHAQKAHSPAYLLALHECKRENCYGVFDSNILPLLSPEPSSCSVPYVDGLGSGGVLSSHTWELCSSPSDPVPLLPPVCHGKQRLSAFCCMTGKSLGLLPFWPFQVLPKPWFDSC